MPDKFVIEFNQQTLEVIAAAIRELPFRIAAPILQDLQRQVDAQKASEETDQ